MGERQRRGRRFEQEAMLEQVSGSVSPGGVAASEIAGESEAPSSSTGAIRRLPRVTLALSAFIMSLTVTLISAYYALQGPEILVRAPEQVLLYRDGEGTQSILGFDIRLDMINGASDYGDVMLDAELTPSHSDTAFRFQSVVRPIFTGTSADTDGDCEVGSRCIALPGLRLIEDPDALVDLPGGSAKAMHLSFPAAQWNCKGPASACARYANFDEAAAAIAANPLNLKITLKFNRDGERRILCSGGRIDLIYLRTTGWMTLGCTESDVSGAPWL